jgi:hypothetical protein
VIFSKTSLRRLNQIILIWTLLHLSMAVALHWINPQAIDVLCTRAGKIEIRRNGNIDILSTNDLSVKHSYNNSLECPLCIGLNDVLPPHFSHDLGLVRFITHQLELSLTIRLLSYYFASLPPPARAPPIL